MLKNWLFLSSFLLSTTISTAQTSSALTTQTIAQNWDKLSKQPQVSFVSSNWRYAQDQVPDISITNQWKTTAWRGEKVHTQVLVWSKRNVKSIEIETSDLKNAQGAVIKKENISTGFVGYVMTDEFAGGCGYRKPVDFDSSLVADAIQSSAKLNSINGKSVQPIWITVVVPADALPGVYSGKINLKGGVKEELRLSITVSDRVLPPPASWKFKLDLWQHPAAIARVHQVALWSDAHFDWMKKYYTMLAAAGQKNITASIVDEPWGHQTYDDYPGLIRWIKKADGTWSYDYNLFDKYISFVMSCGIRDRINCYSMVPWKIAFRYFDEAAGKDTVFTESIGSPSYDTFWRSMLIDFTKHLKEKGWFEKAVIAMDERPMAQMQVVIKLLKEVDSNWKIALAGEYHPELERDIDDYCIASRWQFPKDTLQIRQTEGKLSTWYTCCTENYPNGFTFSPPAEHVWIGWYTAAKNMDGYLRWAYNSWPANPILDSRFTAWPAGDTYQVYPGPMSSIRFEKLIEGIQDYEKIRMLREEFKKNNQQEKLNQLEKILSDFEISKLSAVPAETMVNEAKRRLAELSSGY